MRCMHGLARGDRAGKRVGEGSGGISENLIVSSRHRPGPRQHIAIALCHHPDSMEGGIEEVDLMSVNDSSG